MKEKTERNISLYEYHLKHPHTGCTKMGRVFKLSPSAVWRILQREKKRAKTCPLCGNPDSTVPVHNDCANLEQAVADHA